MITVTPEIAAAVATLNNDGNFKIFEKWLRDSMDATMFASISVPQDPQRSWLQGRAQVLTELVGFMKDPEGHMRRAAENAEKRMPRGVGV